jgi:hypothetical protein
MKSTRHEILRSQWIELMKEKNESGLSVRNWCLEKNISAAQYYYWLRIIREDSLIKAGAMAVTGQTKFAEVKTNDKIFPTTNQRACAVIRSNGHEIEILNGADSETLYTILNLVGRL